MANIGLGTTSGTPPTIRVFHRNGRYRVAATPLAEHDRSAYPLNTSEAVYEVSIDYQDRHDWEPVMFIGGLWTEQELPRATAKARRWVDLLADDGRKTTKELLAC